MGGNYRRPHRSEPRQVRQDHHFLLATSQSSATSHDLVHAHSPEDIGTPEFHFQFNDTYPSQLKFSGEEDIPNPSSTAILEPTVKAIDQKARTAANTPWITTQDGNFNEEIKLLYVPIMRPWEEQLLNPQGTKSAYSDQIQTPLAAWESQEPLEEPFSNIGEVAVKPAHRQQEEPSRLAGRLRQGGRMKRRRL